MSDQDLDRPWLFADTAIEREQLIARFEEAWRNNERPSVDAFLAGEGDQRRALLLELVHADLEFRLKAGEPVRVEEYLNRYAGLKEDATAVLELICAESTLRCRSEPDLSVAEYFQRLPEYHEQLAKRLRGTYAAEFRSETQSVAQAATVMADALSATSEPPRVFGRYCIVKELGGGSMGKVYLAHDTQLDRDVALKIPRFHPDESTEMIARFYREARAMAALRHANLCTVYDVGEIQGVHYLTMACIDGRPLSKWTNLDRKLPSRTAVALVRTLALALHEAHRAGVVHRDLKPANIIIDKAGQPVVVDFGLAHRQRGGEQRLTARGTSIGTPAYMSPEQVVGHLESIGPLSDVYSLGVILYQLLAGRLPFRGSANSIFAKILRDEPPRPSAFNPAADSAIETVCLKAMAKTPEQRFGSMEEMAKALSDYLADSEEDAFRPADPAE